DALAMAQAAAAGEAASGEVAAPAGQSAAAEEDDDDVGGLWLMLGVSAIGAGISLLHDDNNDDSGPGLNVISGQVVKGYVQGAAVYLDLDGDGQPDGEPVYTDAEGRFTFETTASGASLLAYGGVDTLTNSPFDGVVLRAPAGSTVITPLTTLIDEMMKQEAGLPAADAQARLAQAFGLTLPAGTSLLSFDA